MQGPVCGEAKARRRLAFLAKQIVQLLPRSCAGPSPAATQEEIFGPQKGLFSSSFAKPGETDPLSEARLKELFGPQASIEGPLAKSGIGRKFHNIDLSKPLRPEQAAFLVDALDQYSLISFPGQDLGGRFTLAHYERFANHFGALQPMFADLDEGAKDLSKPPLATMHKTRAKVDETFPGQLEHMKSESPAILTITNVEPKKAGKDSAGGLKVRGGGGWHTDQDFERLPCNASMFLIHKNPTRREPDSGTWLKEGSWDQARHFERMYVYPAGEELARLRQAAPPLNGETSYADTVAAFEALSKEEQARLEKIYLRTYMKEGDDIRGAGFMRPLIRRNPRTGRASLYSPIYGNRMVGAKIPPVEIEGMTPDEARDFLNRLEAHVIQPQFRYDHKHTPGDVTIWNNYTLLHSAPPMKLGIDSLDDARLYYRISTKGPPALTLPRKDTDEWLKENFVNQKYKTPSQILNVD